MSEPKTHPSPSAGASPPPPEISLQPSPKRSPSKPSKLLRQARAVFRALPILSPACRIPLHGSRLHNHVLAGSPVTGTIFGHRRSRVTIAFQENPRFLPLVLLELATPTEKLLQDMEVGLVRLALECEKPPLEKKKKNILEEPLWSLYCNGKKMGYGVRRDPTEEDLKVMETLKAVSAGVGVLPAVTPEEGEGVMYMRAGFERVTGSKDSETFYMVSPEGNGGPELSVFFVRV